jgi:hypothetical protein
MGRTTMPRRQRSPTGGQANFYINNCGEFRPKWQERRLFLKLCICEPVIDRLRSYEEANIISPARSIVVETRSVSHD